MMAIVPQLEPVEKAIKMEMANVRVGSRRKSRAGFVSISEKKRSVWRKQHRDEFRVIVWWSHSKRGQTRTATTTYWAPRLSWRHRLTKLASEQQVLQRSFPSLAKRRTLLRQYSSKPLHAPRPPLPLHHRIYAWWIDEPYSYTLWRWTKLFYHPYDLEESTIERPLERQPWSARVKRAMRILVKWFRFNEELRAHKNQLLTPHINAV